MAKLKTQFNDLVSYQEPSPLFSKTHFISLDLNDNQQIDLTQYNDYTVIFNANGTTFSGTLELNLPTNIQIQIINFGGFEIDGGVFDWSSSSDDQCIYEHENYNPTSGSSILSFGVSGIYGFGGNLALVQMLLFTKFGRRIQIDTATNLEP